MLEQQRELKKRKLKERDGGGDALTGGSADGFAAFFIIVAQLMKAQGLAGNIDKVAVLYGQSAPTGLDAVDPDAAL